MATQRELLTGCRPCGYILYTVEGWGRVWRGVPRSVVPVQGAEKGGGKKKKITASPPPSAERRMAADKASVYGCEVSASGRTSWMCQPVCL